jgi:hypothetical protein
MAKPKDESGKDTEQNNQTAADPAPEDKPALHRIVD